MPDHLSIAQAADRLGVSRRRVRQLVTLGRLPAEKVGQYYIISEAAVAAYQPKPEGRPRKIQETTK